MQINTIQQWTTNPVQVFFYGPRRTNAFLVRMVVIPAGTWIHGGDEKEVGGKGDLTASARDRYFAVLKWLTKHFQRSAGELRELVEK